MAFSVDDSGNVTIGTLTVTGTMTLPTSAASWVNSIPRAALAQDALARHWLPLRDAVEHDDVDDPLPDAATGAYLGRGYNDTFATDSISLETGDVKNTNSTRYARWPEVHLPADYDDGQTIVLEITAAMVTTLADTSCTLDVEVYAHDGDTTVTGDKYAGAAVDINENVDTFTARTFSLDATGLTSSTILDIRVAIAYNDGQAVNSVYAVIAKAELKYDRR